MAAAFPPRVMLFVVLFAWYLWAVVDLRLVFLERDMLFLWNIDYFTDFIGQPGALLEWTDKLLVQLCCSDWFAAAAIAAAAWLLFVSTIALMNGLGRARIAGTWVIPGMLLVSLYGSYRFPTSALVGLAVAITAAALWCRTTAGRPWLRFLLFGVFSALLYYVLGEACYCFAACCVISEALANQRWLAGLLLLLIAAAVKFGSDVILGQLHLASHNFHVFFLTSHEQIPLDWREKVLYFYYPACAIFAVYYRPVAARLQASWPRSSKPHRSADHRISRMWAVIRWATSTGFVLLLAGISGFISFHTDRKLAGEIDYYAERQQWDQVLAKFGKLAPDSRSKSIIHDVNLAFYHTGRLPYQSLLYGEDYRFPALFIPEQLFREVNLLRKPFGFLLELGRISEAERLALETLETRPTGAVLKGLAITKMIRRQPAAARLLLNVLRDDLVWGRWAEGYLQRLAADPDLATDEMIQRSRALMVAEDDLHLTTVFDDKAKGVLVDPKTMLLNLLKRNGANQMAFEYLMAIYLSNRDIAGIAELFPYIEGLPYQETPSPYEEAALVYLSSHPQEAKPAGSGLFFHGRKISNRTLDKYRRLKAIAATNGGLNQKAESAVARELGDTYFYHFYYPSRKQP